MSETAREPRSLTQVLKDRLKTTKEKLHPTHIENMSLRVQPGIKIDAPKAAIRGIQRAAIAMGRFEGRIAKMEGKKDASERVLTDFAQTYPGFLGFRSKDDNMLVSVYREAKVKYHNKELKKALGAASSAVIGEKLKVTFTIPLGHETGEGLLTSKKAQTHIERAIEDLNFPKAELKKILHTEIVPRYDEPILLELSENGQVELPPEAATVTDTLHVRITPIDKTLLQIPVAVNPSHSTSS
jgi:hypothetical protein